jgi:hypothetical protein
MVTVQGRDAGEERPCRIRSSLGKGPWVMIDLIPTAAQIKTPRILQGVVRVMKL